MTVRISPDRRPDCRERIPRRSCFGRYPNPVWGRMFGPTVGIGGLAASHLTSPIRLQRWTTSFLVYQRTYVVPGTVRNGFDRQFSVSEQRGVQMPTWPEVVEIACSRGAAHRGGGRTGADVQPVGEAGS